MNKPDWLDRIVEGALGGGLPALIFAVALLAGAIALQWTPREEEPQIVVPMVDVRVAVPGLDATQIERQVTQPLEKLLAQIPGVEHLYASSFGGGANVTLRFFVGEDREDALLNTYNKLYSHQDQVPAIVSNWQVRPVEVDDVAILLLGLWSSDPGRYSDFELRRVADELTTGLQALPQVSEIQVVGGRERKVQVQLDPERLAARLTTPIEVAAAIAQSNLRQSAGALSLGNRTLQLEGGDFFDDLDALRNQVVNVVDATPVYLQDVAAVVDGPAEPSRYSWIDFANPEEAEGRPMVAISIAKQRGSNAVAVAAAVHAEVARLQAELLPPEIQVTVLRDYGQTANDKVNNLVSSLAFAVFTVVVFIGVFLGWRPALVVGLAVPICYGITLALDLWFGYTINRVTLFALILSLGLLVDDPITGVDNIERFMRGGEGGTAERVVTAIREIRVPLLMSTLAIVLAFLPLAYITGMMGPYMAPMAFNVPVSVGVSTLVAFLVTPWLASRLLRPNTTTESAPPSSMEAAYRGLLAPLLAHRNRARWLLWVVLGLFLLAAALPLLRLVPLKLLPFDNKSEVQIVIDLPEGSTLEQTAAMAQRVSLQVRRLPEVTAVAAFVGEPSPIDFNGMVRQYYLRTQPHQADLRLTLVDKSEREHQSHAVVLRLRQLLHPLNAGGVTVKVVEVPPGPPVMSTLVAEVTADTLVPYARQQEAARQLMARLAQEPHVVEIDASLEQPAQRLRFVLDKQKAALSGVSTDDANQLLALANGGLVAGYLQQPREARPLPVELRLPSDQRTGASDFERLQLKGRPGVVQQQNEGVLDAAPQPLVALGELGEFVELPAEPARLRKDQQPIIYVTAELNGRTPAEIIADVHADLGKAPGESSDWQQRTFINSGAGLGWSLPPGTDIRWTGEGEWRITKDVFRDMGLAFIFALLGIFFVLRAQTGSAALSLIIMLAIPLTVIGIMPGFWLLNQFGERVVAGAPEPVLFTATAMIGMIALAGIVVRNSLILVEFISQARAEGASIKEALIQAGAVRMRPVLLTAGTTLLGNLVIILDPVFSGLALAIIFGIIASTLFTLLVVPVVYLLVFDRPEAAVNEE
ncbi:efflux RND transporter permease subunit [Motiliproteus sp. SC1-56]|uniref:efflux RND transporter permease subunit n=1 Tax=Motiliproteus sp. SC1-56 TaxID=2799565 RepID=UPI001A8E8B8A|nr:efflux RND transporter permease subunit [Motiliproteus sp. SC1-56]